jgi:hypothetical protein
MALQSNLIVSVVNILFALSALPPSIYLVRLMLRERKMLDGSHTPINNLLIFVFMIHVLVAIFNIAFYVYFIYSVELTNTVFIVGSIRSLLANLAVTTCLWAIVFIHLKSLNRL